jgi:anti-sigma-K factor RskA
MTCHTIDELAAAYGLGALDPDEERAVSEHLATCLEPHADARELIGVAAIVPAADEPIIPSTALRGRLMATIAATPQDHAIPAPVAIDPVARRRETMSPDVTRRPWWSIAPWGPLPSAIAAAGVAAAVGLGAWGISLNAELAERDEALRMVAAADGAFAVRGDAGSGWLLESDGRAIFLADALADLPSDRLYELWLIDADGIPAAVGTTTDTDGVALVELEAELGSATTFAVTIEAERVDAPTGDPVLVASLEG